MRLKNLICGCVSILIGVGVFVTIQVVTKEYFEPIVSACTSPWTLPDFIKKTSYKAYEGRLGGFFVCLITQFLHDLTVANPAGFIMWNVTVQSVLISSIIMCSEAGRSGAKGLILFPELFFLLGQLFGISVIFPTFWVPLIIYNSRLVSPITTITPGRAYACGVPGLFFLFGTIFLFHIFGTTTYEWTFTAGVLGGPLIALAPLFLRLLPVLENPTSKDVTRGSQALSAVYMGTAIIGLLSWMFTVVTAVNFYGLDVKSLWKDIWPEAHPSVAFMSMDAIGLFLGIVIYVISISSVLEAIVIFGLLLTTGPCTSCGLILARIEMQRAMDASIQHTKKLD